MPKIAIIVQARSTSTRFPNKILEPIGGKPMLKCVLDSCKASADYLNYANNRTEINAQVAMVVPRGDPISRRWLNCVQIFEGSEQDVLARYVSANEILKADYICRITSDCPLIPPYLISKHITIAVINEYDYVSNVDLRFRTSPDGWDCEVLSSRMLTWLSENASDQSDREHVTMLVRKAPPPWARLGHTIGFIDLSDIKISVDTHEDLLAVSKQLSSVRSKVDTAVEYFGKEHVHRF